MAYPRYRSSMPISSPLLRFSPLATAILCAFGYSADSLAEHAWRWDEDMLEIPIEGGIESTTSDYKLDSRRVPETRADTAALLPRAPGANVNRNGPLTGIAQYRGMYGDRVNTSIDGMYTLGACPNGMDPPLSYIPRSQLSSLTVIRGIAPVSSGAETIGGSILATSRRSQFSAGEAVTPSLELSTGAGSVDNSRYIDSMASVANRSHRLHVFGSREKGGNYKFPGGTVKPTRFERDSFGSGYGFRSGKQEISLDLRRNETGPTGTPALPMDIVNTNATLAEGEYRGELNGYQLHGKVYWTDDNHRMSNYKLRNVPITRLNDASSDGAGYRLDSSFAFGKGQLSVGTDGRLAQNNATIVDPVNNPAFRIVNFNDVTRDVYGFFAEWNGAVRKDWNVQLGARYNRVLMDAGQVAATVPPANALQTRFNNADRSKTDDNLDLVARLTHPVSSRLTLEIEAGRKTRSPSYQERYLWLPLEATGGLADGNIYVGDIDLDPEVAYEIGTGFDWHTRRYYFEPRVFYRYVDNYIQGVPATDPLAIAFNPSTLQYANVDATLYGGDAPWGVALNDNWSLDGVVSYVRGKRDDISDNLYRIAPLNGRATLTYRRTNWWTAAEGVAYADQDKVSKTNRETKSDGYLLLNLRAGIALVRNLVLSAGVDNVFDKHYADHLSGINRVVGTDVALGERIPGYGRNYYASLKLSYD
jgi:iron complex outermembrane receptor protein